MESEDAMTEQEKKELLDELEKRIDEKYKGCLTREDVATTLKVPREKWFKDENGHGAYSLMTDAFDSSIISWQVWETIRKLAYRDWETDRKSTRLNSSHSAKSRMPSSA